jgi:S1-C subfamily serine protease
MKRFRSLFVAAALLAVNPFVGLMHAASEAEAAAGRALVKRYADSIVSIELVVTVRLKSGDREMPAREQRVEVNGTVVSADGLTLTSLALVDPQSQVDALRSQGNSRIELLGSDFKEVKLRMADGSEVPAKFVLKDSDLDLAFMAPDYAAGATKKEYSFVNLDSAATGEVLRTYFSVVRAPKALQRVPLVRINEIMGVVEKPRKFYLVSDPVVGTPTFDEKGQVLGIALQNLTGGSRLVVLPAADIAEMAKQAAAQAATAPSSVAPSSAAASPAALDSEKKE